jgi:hypothetical protein
LVSRESLLAGVVGLAVLVLADVAVVAVFILAAVSEVVVVPVGAETVSLELNAAVSAPTCSCFLHDDNARLIATRQANAIPWFSGRVRANTLTSYV